MTVKERKECKQIRNNKAFENWCAVNHDLTQIEDWMSLVLKFGKLEEFLTHYEAATKIRKIFQVENRLDKGNI